MKNTQINTFLQKKNHVSEDRGPLAHVRGREEVGGLHVSGNHQEGNCHVSTTSSQQSKQSDIGLTLWRRLLGLQGHDDDRLRPLGHHQTLGGAKQGERKQHLRDPPDPLLV